jgi:hypothetical protein
MAKGVVAGSAVILAPGRRRRLAGAEPALGIAFVPRSTPIESKLRTVLRETGQCAIDQTPAMPARLPPICSTGARE